MNDKDKLDFEDLFKEENENIDNEEKTKVNKSNNQRRSILGIVIYLFISIFVAALLLLLFNKSPYTKEVVEPDQIAIIYLVNNTDLVTIIKKDEYEKYPKYHSYLKAYEYDDEYYFIINEGRLNGKTSITFFVEQEIDEVATKTELLLIDNSILVKESLDLYFANTKAQWQEDKPLKLLLTGAVKPDFIGDDLWAYSIGEELVINKSIEQLTELALAGVNLILYVLMFAFIFLTMFPMIKEDFKNFFSLKGKAWISVGVGFIILYAFGIAGNVIQNLIGILLQIDPQTSANQASIELALKSNAIYFTLISAILIGPIVEEMVFRKAIFSIIKNKWAAIILSSLVFALIHVVSEFEMGFGILIYNLIPYLAMGLAFGWIYSNNKNNLMTTIFVHMIYNLVATLMVFII